MHTGLNALPGHSAGLLGAKVAGEHDVAAIYLPIDDHRPSGRPVRGKLPRQAAGEFEVGRQEAREGRQLTVQCQARATLLRQQGLTRAQPALAELPAVRRQAQARRRGSEIDRHRLRQVPVARGSLQGGRRQMPGPCTLRQHAATYLQQTFNIAACTDRADLGGLVPVDTDGGGIEFDAGHREVGKRHIQAEAPFPRSPVIPCEAAAADDQPLPFDIAQRTAGVELLPARRQRSLQGQAAVAAGQPTAEVVNRDIKTAGQRAVCLGLQYHAGAVELRLQLTWQQAQPAVYSARAAQARGQLIERTFQLGASDGQLPLLAGDLTQQLHAPLDIAGAVVAQGLQRQATGFEQGRPAQCLPVVERSPAPQCVDTTGILQAQVLQFESSVFMAAGHAYVQSPITGSAGRRVQLEYLAREPTADVKLQGGRKAKLRQRWRHFNQFIQRQHLRPVRLERQLERQRRIERVGAGAGGDTELATGPDLHRQGPEIPAGAEAQFGAQHSGPTSNRRQRRRALCDQRPALGKLDLRAGLPLAEPGGAQAQLRKAQPGRAPVAAAQAQRFERLPGAVNIQRRPLQLQFLHLQSQGQADTGHPRRGAVITTLGQDQLGILHQRPPHPDRRTADGHCSLYPPLAPLPPLPHDTQRIDLQVCSFHGYGKLEQAIIIAILWRHRLGRRFR